MLRERRTIGTVTKDITYTYSLGRLLTSIVYRSGQKVEYTNSNAGRPLTAKDTTNPSSPINYALNAPYAPQGALTNMLNGQRQGFDGTTASWDSTGRRLATPFRLHIPPVYMQAKMGGARTATALLMAPPPVVEG